MSAAASLLDPYRPDIDGPWTRVEAAHLLRRTLLGPAPREIDEALAVGPNDAIAGLFAVSRDGAGPAEVDTLYRGADSIADFQASLVLRLVHSSRPLLPRTLLFWHGHFATSLDKVGSVTALRGQFDLFETRGLGPFGPLLHGIARDPAMLLWLDGNRNRRRHPNENFARELFELFSLGIGNYTEHDVAEAARAFTGWHVRDGAFRFDPDEHDPGRKTVLGRTGDLDGDDVVEGCLAHAATPRFLAGKLLAAFVAPAPSASLLDEAGALLLDLELDTGAFLRRLLVSRLFFAPASRLCIVRSPAELVIGTLRCLGVRFRAAAAHRSMAAMGQSLGRPPSVKGWDGGAAWLSTAAVAARLSFAAALRDGSRGPLLAGEPPPDAAEALALMIDGGTSPPASGDPLYDALTNPRLQLL